MKIRYKRHHLYPESILFRNFSGKINIEDIIDSWEFLNKNNLINEEIMGVINDLSNCELNLDMESFKTLISYLKKQNFLEGKKLAVICDSPKTIIFPVMGESLLKKIKIKPFSTEEAAVKWISTDIF